MRKPSKPSHPTSKPSHPSSEPPGADSLLPTNVLPHRHQDRNGDGDDNNGGDATLLGRVAIRFADLKASGIVDSWAGLAHFIRAEGFPRGHQFGKRTRIWWRDEVLAWL